MLDLLIAIVTAQICIDALNRELEAQWVAGRGANVLKEAQLAV